MWLLLLVSAVAVSALNVDFGYSFPNTVRPHSKLEATRPATEGPQNMGITVEPVTIDVKVPCNEGSYQRDPADCGAYFLCVYGEWQRFSCQEPLMWDQNKRICDWPMNVKCKPTVGGSAGAAGETTGNLPPQTTTTTVPPPSVDLGTVSSSGSLSVLGVPGVSRVTCESGSRQAHESDCRKFYECVHGEMQERQCFPGLHWHSQANRCDWPNQANCKSQGTSPVAVGSNPPRPPSTTSTTTLAPWRPPPTVEQKPMTTSRPVTSGPALPDTGYKVVCYFTNWAWYRRGIGKYKPEDIDPDLCTHIVYAFAVLDGTKLLIKPHDTWADYDNAFYKKVTDLRDRGVKVLIAIGGWNDSAGDKYSRLVNNPAARAKFNAHVIEFMQRHNFDGLDLDWEYPVCWQIDCSKGNPNDKAAFSAWVRELHTTFKPHGFLLSAAVSPSNKVIDAGYDVPSVNRYLDWIAVMTYDYHGHWDNKTGHVAPMYHHPGHDNPAFNVNFTIHYWLEKGADRKKIVMGMPMYGQAFGLGWKADGTGLGQHAPNKGAAGQYTRAAGFLAYYEICDKIINGGFTVVKDPEGRMGPYAYQGKQWFGYDDIAMTRYKSEYIKNMGLGGGMIWALDLDDFRNRCGCEEHPLLRTINRVLRNYPVPDPNCNI